MAAGRRERQAARRNQTRAAMVVAAPAAAGPILFGDWQRRVVLMLLFSGLGFGTVGALVAPRGAAYWLAVVSVPVIAALVGFVLGGASGRSLEGRLIGGDTARDSPRLASPETLAAPVRDALQTALLPVLLAELGGAAGRMAPRQRMAAQALIEAGATAPESEARGALARDLPRLITALADGDATATDETEALSRRLARPTPPARGAP